MPAMLDFLLKAMPSAGTIALVVIGLVVVHHILERGPAALSGRRFRNQVVMLGLTAAGALAIILVIPVGDAMRGQLLQLFGLLLTVAIALSSTTLLGNGMAGVMLRAVRNFRMGDFIRVGDHFGRVCERGLFHTEIQTEDRELTTLPNLFLVTNPVTTTRASGTIVSATVSLGYDVPRVRIEELLLGAAAKVALGEAFVRISELGDFSVTYRIAGLLTEVKQMLSVQSRLRAAVMDALHEGGVEIVSPTFMNTRALDERKVFIPRPETKKEVEEATPEVVVFDKAEEAESLEALRGIYASVVQEIGVVKEQRKKLGEGSERDAADRDLSALQLRKERLEKMISAREARAAENE